jgi:hypothetical protein
MSELPILFVVAIIIGAPVGLLVRYFLFRIGCVLADLPDPSIGKSILAVGIAVAVTIPLLVVGGFILSVVDALVTKQAGAGAIFYPGMAVDMIVCWLLAAVVYWLLLSTSYTKGLIVAGVELLLSALAAALVTAVILVIGAGWQVSTRGTPAGTDAAPTQNKGAP